MIRSFEKVQCYQEAILRLRCHYPFIVDHLYYIFTFLIIYFFFKPANILLNSECVCKVADFGLARSIQEQHSSMGETYDPSLTDYIATRWYRAPEILVASKM